MQSSSISLTPEYNNRWRYVPLLTPAVKHQSCEVDDTLLEKRTQMTAMAAIVAVGASIALAIVWPAAAIAIPVFVGLGFFAYIGVGSLDRWIAERAANVKAVQEYLNSAPPSFSATSRIRGNLAAAQMLVNKGGDVNKVNTYGDRLLSLHANTFEMFKLFVDHGADVKATDHQGVSYFQRAVEWTKPRFLEYILQVNKAKAEDFSPTQQVYFWSHLGCAENGYLLNEHHFDVNIRDEKGYTPLLKLVEIASSPFFEQNTILRALDIRTHANTLLACDADRSLTMIKDGIEKNAKQMNTNLLLTGIL